MTKKKRPTQLERARAEVERLRKANGTAQTRADHWLEQFDQASTRLETLSAAARRLLARAWQTTVTVRSVSAEEADAEEALRAAIAGYGEVLEAQHKREIEKARAEGEASGRWLHDRELCDAITGRERGQEPRPCGVRVSDPDAHHDHFAVVREMRAEVARLREALIEAQAQRDEARAEAQEFRKQLQESEKRAFRLRQERNAARAEVERLRQTYSARHLDLVTEDRTRMRHIVLKVCAWRDAGPAAREAADEALRRAVDTYRADADVERTRAQLIAAVDTYRAQPEDRHEVEQPAPVIDAGEVVVRTRDRSAPRSEQPMNPNAMWNLADVIEFMRDAMRDGCTVTTDRGETWCSVYRVLDRRTSRHIMFEHTGRVYATTLLDPTVHGQPRWMDATDPNAWREYMLIPTVPM